MKAPSFRATRIVVCVVLLLVAISQVVLLVLSYHDHEMRMEASARAAEISAQQHNVDVNVEENKRVSARKFAEQVVDLQNKLVKEKDVDTSATLSSLKKLGIIGSWNDVCEGAVWELESTHSMDGTLMSVVWLGVDANNNIVGCATALWDGESERFSDGVCYKLSDVKSDAASSETSSATSSAAEEGGNTDGS